MYEEWTFATVRLVRTLLQRASAGEPAAGAVLVAAVDGLRHNQLATRDCGLFRAAGRRVVERLVRQFAPRSAEE